MRTHPRYTLNYDINNEYTLTYTQNNTIFGFYCLSRERARILRGFGVLCLVNNDDDV